MINSNLYYIVISNFIGIILLGSWLLLENHGFWFFIDSTIFFFFNTLLIKNQAFMYFVSLVNLRGFDLIAFLSMLRIFYGYFKEKNLEEKHRMLCIGVAMLFTAVLIKQVGSLFPFDRTSPTVFFPEEMHTPVNLISKLSGWHTKCQSSDCFPGDHGIMLLIFSSFMWRYCGFAAFKKGLIVFLLFSLPRIMGGAHWFTDIAVGSISVTLIVISWILLTPLSDLGIAKLEKWLPIGLTKKYFSQ